MKLKITTAMMLLALAVPVLRAQQSAAQSDTPTAKFERATYRPDSVLSQFDNGKKVSGISVPPAAGTDAIRSNPVVRQSKMSFSSSLTPGKSTTIASVDEVDAPRRMQIDVTATKIK